MKNDSHSDALPAMTSAKMQSLMQAAILERARQAALAQRRARARHAMMTKPTRPMGAPDMPAPALGLELDEAPYRVA